MGCGGGRLLPWLGKYALNCTAIEPDSERLAIAKETYPDVSFEEASIDEHEGSYDLVLCSHVLQHVPSDRVAPTLQKLRNLTKPDGTLILLYSRSTSGQDEYSLDTLRRQQTRSLKVDEYQFNEELRVGSTDVLPIHYFDPDALKQMGEEIGWKETMRWAFHITDSQYSGKNPDNLINIDPSLRRKFGRDMLVIWQRTDKNGAA